MEITNTHINQVMKFIKSHRPAMNANERRHMAKRVLKLIYRRVSFSETFNMEEFSFEIVATKGWKGVWKLIKMVWANRG